MRLKQLFEMPVKSVLRQFDPATDAEIDQDEDLYRFKPEDKKYIQNPKYPAIVTKLLKRTPFDLYVYIRDVKATRDTVGLAVSDKMERKPYSTYYTKVEDIKNLIGNGGYEMVATHPEGVHLLISHNDPFSDEYMRLTPWMIVHRLAHACLDEGQKSHFIFSEVKKIWNLLGSGNTSKMTSYFKFKSAEIAKRKPKSFNQYEMTIECMTSYWYNGGNFSLDLSTADTKTRELYEEKVRKLNFYFGELTKRLPGKLWTG